VSEAQFRPAADMLDGWRTDVLSGKPPTLYPAGEGELARVEIGPGQVSLIGGAPGAGKTGLVMQLTVEALRRTPLLRALVCNVEMHPSALLDRQLARLSDIDLTLIRHRRLGAEHADRVERGLRDLEPLADRLAFVRPPFDLANVAASADAFEAGLIVLDYIQRIPPPGDHADSRGAVGASMNYLRQFADAGMAIVVVAALARSKDAKGRSSYDEGLNLASYRETSELEYGADDAFILAPDGGQGSDRVTLMHLKSRYGEARDIALTFDGKHQRFTPAQPAGPAPTDGGKLQAVLRAQWERARPADDDKEVQ
jgi:replicative DNA helicase